MTDCRALWKLKYLDRFGNYLFDLDYEEFAMNRKKNDEGILNVNMPLGNLDFDLFDCDYRLEVYKVDPDTGLEYLWDNTCWFLRKVDLSVEMSGGGCVENLELQFFDATSLLSRRIVAWLSTEVPQYPSVMYDDAAAMLYAIFFYNFKEGVTDPTLLNTFYAPDFVPASPFSSSPMIDFWQTKVFENNDINLRQMPISMEIPQRCNIIPISEVNVSFENVLNAMQTIVEDAEIRGSLMQFDIVYTPKSQFFPEEFLFKVWCGLRGNDRCDTSDTNRIIIGPEFGNMTNVKITRDYTDTANIIYAGGSGENENREMNSFALFGCPSPFGNIEAFISANNTDSVFSLETDAISEAHTKLPVYQVSGEYISIAPTVFGKDFMPWDRVCFQYKNIVAHADINEYTIDVNSEGETVEIPLNIGLFDV